MKKFFIVTSIFALLLTGCQSAPIHTQDTLRYENTALGYSFKFTENWADYQPQVEGNDVRFGLTTNDELYLEDGEEYAYLFTVSALTHEEWENRNTALPSPTYLDENSDFVFTASAGHDAPVDLSEAYLDISTVLDSFALL